MHHKIQKETESSRAEVQRKLTRMVRFIELEGDEKAQEIIDRTEEEFHIDKGNLIQQGRIKINQEYDKKMGLLKSQNQVELGTIKAKYHDMLLRYKRDSLAVLLDEIQERITTDLNCVNRRWSVLQLLIMEALFRLLENKVTLRCREADVPFISKHISDLEAKYELHTNSKINLTLDSNCMPDDNLPGIMLFAHEGKMQVSNSLDNRIRQIVDFISPLLSIILYGTRKLRTHS